MFIPIHILRCLHLFVHIYVHTDARAYVHICVHIYVPTDVRAYVHIYIHGHAYQQAAFAIQWGFSLVVRGWSCVAIVSVVVVGAVSAVSVVAVAVTATRLP